LNPALRPEKQASCTFPVLLSETIKAALTTPMASVNASSTWGHASGETAVSWIVETREDMANRILKARLAEKLNNF
jgi:hypothetical protein